MRQSASPRSGCSRHWTAPGPSRSSIMADSAESLATTVYDQLDSKGYLTDLRKFESHPSFPSGVPYMYADSSGYITVGVGHNLSAHGLGGLTFVVKRKERYPFVLRKGRTYTTGAAGT